MEICVFLFLKILNVDPVATVCVVLCAEMSTNDVSERIRLVATAVNDTISLSSELFCIADVFEQVSGNLLEEFEGFVKDLRA